MSFSTYASNATNETHHCCGLYRPHFFNNVTGAPTPRPRLAPDVKNNAYGFPNFAVSIRVAEVVGLPALRLWLLPMAFNQGGAIDQRVVFGAPLRLHNGTYAGMTLVHKALASVTEALRSEVAISGIADAIVITDADQIVYASSTGSDWWHVNLTMSDAEATRRSECNTNSPWIDEIYEPRIVLCRDEAATTGYGPLRAFAQSGRLGDVTRGGSGVLAATVRDGDLGTVYVVSTRFVTQLGPAGLVVTSFIREEVLHGGALSDAAWATAGIVAVVLVVTMAAAFVAVQVLLMPLPVVVRELRLTSRLRGRGGRPKVRARAAAAQLKQSKSVVVEMHDLRRALMEMTSMLGALSGYAPWDVMRSSLNTRSGGAGGARRGVTGSATATVMCVGVQGLSWLLHHAEAGAASGVMDCFSDDLQRAVEGAGGAVVAFHGDAAVCAFGAPRALANAEVHACAAALQVARACEVGRTGAAVDALGEALRARIGIATGRVVLGETSGGERSYFFMAGQAVEAATRLQAHAAVLETRPLAALGTASAVSHVFVTRTVVLRHDEELVGAASDTGLSGGVSSPNACGGPGEWPTLPRTVCSAVEGAAEVVGLRDEAGPGDELRLRGEEQRLLEERTQARSVATAAGAPSTRRAKRSRRAAALRRDPLSDPHDDRLDEGAGGADGDTASDSSSDSGATSRAGAPGRARGRTARLLDAMRGLEPGPHEVAAMDAGLVRGLSRAAEYCLAGKVAEASGKAARLRQRLPEGHEYSTTLDVLLGVLAEMHASDSA